MTKAKVLWLSHHEMTSEQASDLLKTLDGWDDLKIETENHLRVYADAGGARRQVGPDYVQARKVGVPVTTPADVRLDSLAAYETALKSWAAKTLSSPELRWRSPGTYRFDGYADDDGRPVATLEKTPW